MRNFGIDLLRGLAAFGIVGCHLSLSPVAETARMVLSACDFNVAIFAVLAGFLMRIESGLIEYAGRRITRILPTYFVWSAVFILSSICFQLLGDGVDVRFSTWKYWIDVILWGGASCHLWFLICLLYAQILIVCMGRVMNRTSILMLGVALVLFASTGQSFYHLYPLRMLGFVCVGYGVQELNIRWPFSRVYCWGGCCCFALVGNIFLSRVIPSFIGDLIGVVPVIFFFQELSIDRLQGMKNKAAVQRIVQSFGATSMVVFLVHPIITRVGSVVVSKYCAAPYSGMTIAVDWMLCWLLAFTFATIALKVPYCRRVVS